MRLCGMPPLDAIRARFRAPPGPLRDAIRLALNGARHFSFAVSRAHVPLRRTWV